MAGWTRRHGGNPFPSSIPARVICKGPQNLEKPMATVYDKSGGTWGCWGGGWGWCSPSGRGRTGIDRGGRWQHSREGV